MHRQLNLNLRTDHAKERNAKDKVLSVNVGWQLEPRRWAAKNEAKYIMKQPVKAEDNLWKRLYNDHSQAYERMIQCEDYHSNLLTALNEIHPLQQASVVEFGAGTGRITRQLLPIIKTFKPLILHQQWSTSPSTNLTSPAGQIGC